MKKALLVLLFVPLVSFGQNDGAELCYKLGNRSFNTNTEALNSLLKIPIFSIEKNQVQSLN
jgi:hypothetical protein